MILQPDHFAAFFHALWDHEPFPWQIRLAAQVSTGLWPDVIDLPTASGKTACLDAAVFALAVQARRAPSQRTIGRRIFFAVNRRVIVDEAQQRAREIARRLIEATRGSILETVAEELRRLSGDPDAPPLDVAILRGGIYRDNRWARSIAQPTIITSTIDQVGSRLLFRGYGLSEGARPLHAALVAHDSLLLLDEAHISQPFAQTLGAVRRYRGESWADSPVSTPFHVVQMTATPGKSERDIFRLADDDRHHPVIAGRLTARKPARLVVAAKAKGSRALDELAKVVAEQAQGLQAGDCRTVAVIVNRVATARKVHQLLSEDLGASAEVHLAIGRMRPLDRDDLTAAIQARVGKSQQKGEADKPLFVVATQCLEVGADFDFDALVSECASLDALRQRFGRLNRKGRPIQAGACIVIRQDQRSADDDPIYGAALGKTWQWLESVAKGEIVDFGVAAMEKALKRVDLAPLLAPRADAPVMFPAYVDAWVQTSPAPAPDPDVSLFLHGPRRGEPDVQVCWRADLDLADPTTWAQIVGLCPPSSPECMPVPIGLVRAWLAGRADAADEQRGDLLDAAVPEEEEGDHPAPRTALAWRGPSDSRLVGSPADIRPGDTLVLPVRLEGWSLFGHIPGSPEDPAAVDIAERAFRQSHGREILRLTPSSLGTWPRGDALTSLKAWAADPDVSMSIAAIRDTLRQVADTMAEKTEAKDTLRLLAAQKYGLTWQRYPGGKGVVLATRRRVVADQSLLPAMDDGEDETSRNPAQQVSLKDHTSHVCDALGDVLPLLPVALWATALQVAASCHDLGKADERFQAMLLGGDLADAWAQATLWAKSARLPMSPAQFLNAHRRSCLPHGFRHEMLSVQLAEASAALPVDPALRDLVLHLVASHHGHARPFAPVVIDDAPPDVSLPGSQVGLTCEQRRQRPPHRLDSGIPERFWNLTRHFGWWGLAYLEAILRLADQRASQREEESDSTGEGGSIPTQEAVI